MQEGMPLIMNKLRPHDFGKPGSGKGIRLDDLEISEEEMEMYVDLHPITNRSPYTVMETLSLAKTAVLFRELGLRHLLVLPKTPGVRKPLIINYRYVYSQSCLLYWLALQS
jgi:chloride channel 7